MDRVLGVGDYIVVKKAAPERNPSPAPVEGAASVPPAYAIPAPPPVPALPSRHLQELRKLSEAWSQVLHEVRTRRAVRDRLVDHLTPLPLRRPAPLGPRPRRLTS